MKILMKILLRNTCNLRCIISIITIEVFFKINRILILLIDSISSKLNFDTQMLSLHAKGKRQ